MAPLPQVVSDQPPSLIASSPGAQNLVDAVVLFLVMERPCPAPSGPALPSVCLCPGQAAQSRGLVKPESGGDANTRGKHALCRRSRVLLPMALLGAPTGMLCTGREGAAWPPSQASP